MKPYFVYCLTICLGFAAGLQAQDYRLSSPDGKVTVAIFVKDSLHFSVSNNKEICITRMDAHLALAGGKQPGIAGKVVRAATKSVQQQIKPAVPVKNSVIDDQYNELKLFFSGQYRFVMRAYNDGVAYRFETDFPDSITVIHETADVHPPAGSQAYFQWVKKWMNHYEHTYEQLGVDSLTATRVTQLPLLITTPQAGKVLITESDLYDYPGLYFTGNGDGTMKAIYPPVVKTERVNKRGTKDWDRRFFPIESEPFIARTAGSRTFPWRILALAQTDIQLLNNEIVYKLGAPNKLANTDWIKPGQVAWDWWNNWDITGVDFRAGVNTATYKYYIDFAAKNHIPYIIMDEGWYELGDLTKISPEVDVKAIIDYGKQRNVGVILWCVWRTLDEQLMPAMKLFRDWGAKGIKVDFMDRDDQAVVNFYWRCAAAAAEHQLLVDFHGAHKPAGINRTWPNVLNFEGVQGMEHNKWSDKNASPQMAVTLPYIRMFAGPMDYTPGAMRNAQQRDFKIIYDKPFGQGTRCQQLAMYVLYDAPLQMLCDNPVAYEKETECTAFITQIPVIWDQTIPLQGEIGEYLVMARKKGTRYYLGALTNWTARDIVTDLSFLPSGTHRITIFKDGINADRNATDYKKEVQMLTNRDSLRVHLAPGGGFAAIIE
ncbi:glycoside hydrolase family 97 protein [Chitinophaga nivalis]|uniref:Glycoside hydrolase family 97 protein n=1 Tax=Chitinophaga nivalis TaxID=2991709 RepID=A0ABT3IPC8_9BACT|nr:glycoside hydrolase family 97 protein [Chitinophaga nivalis]MCW3464490.1 glycoside hydrolase family 97 protein [Chitinophaga nivalis]MCW3485819.1 glycoside hydrolase family 97 protein [Chitinophaga nivalis]